MGRRNLKRVHRKASDKVGQQKKAGSAAPRLHPLVDLQRSVGSAAVQRLIDSPYIQTKLQVSEPEDESEKEADKTAQSVMRSEVGAAPVGHTAGPGVAHQLSSGGGPASPLPNTVRDFMEPRLGADLGDVRVHTGSEAARLNDQLQAQAFTHGQDVYFGAGKSPGIDTLTAHELAHVVQQTGAVNPQLISRSPDDEKKKGPGETDPKYWFQNKPPEKPIETKEGIRIEPKGQVVVDPAIHTINSKEFGNPQIQFAGMDSDFQAGKPTPKFAAAEKAIENAIAGAIADLSSVGAIDPGTKDEQAKQSKQNQIVRARLKEAVRTLAGKRLNVFIASELTIGEKISKTPLSLSTAQIFVSGDDIGDPKKLQAAIRIPLITLTGGSKGIAPGPGGKMEEASTTALTADQLREALLHELLHVMLINHGASALQVYKSNLSGLVTGPEPVKGLVENVVFRFLRAQEEIFVYSAIEGLYSSFKGNKKNYELYAELIEKAVKSIGGKVVDQKPVTIDVKEKVGPAGKEAVQWALTYKLPKDIKVDSKHQEFFEELQKLDSGT